MPGEDDAYRVIMCFSTLYGSSGFFNVAVAHGQRAAFAFQYPLRVKWILQHCCCPDVAWHQRVSVPSTGQVDSSTRRWRHHHWMGPRVSVPSTGQVDSSTQPHIDRAHCEDLVSVPSTGQVDSSTDDVHLILLRQLVFQYPLRVKWILQRCNPVGRRMLTTRFSTLYGSSGFFNDLLQPRE